MKSKKRSNPRLDLNQVSLFVEVVRAASFAVAARRLGMPANTVSRHVQQLENDVGSRLIHRSTRKLTLTAAGRTFFDRCVGPVSELTQAGQASVDDTQLPAGLVRVAAPADFFDLFSIDWIAEFLRVHPLVNVEFVLDDAKTDLVGESIDVALRAAHLVDDNHVGHKLITTQFGFVASPVYLAARGIPTSLRELRDHDCLPQSGRTGPVTWRVEGPPMGSTAAARADAGVGVDVGAGARAGAGARVGVGAGVHAGEGARVGVGAGARVPSEIQVAGRFRANTARAVLRAAVAGLGIALLPHPITFPEVEAGRLARVLPQYRRDGADLYAICLSRRQIPRAVSAFIEFVGDRLKSTHVGQCLMDDPIG